MKNQDTLFNQFQKAAQNVPLEKAPQHEAIWDKIESRLDQKELTSKKQQWKRIAIAACLLLVTTLLFQWFQNTALVTITAPVAIQDTIQNAVATAPKPADTIASTALKPEANAILKKQLETTPLTIIDTPPPPVEQHNKPIEPLKKAKAMPFKNRIFEARGVTYTDADGVAEETHYNFTTDKAPALVVLDDKAITGATKNYKEKTENKLKNADDIESITILPNPLYIINGVEYTEMELFGPQPTSPYHPLNEQDIIDTKILQGTEATSAFGEKGAKGVVIITTKNGKPKPQKQPNK